MDTCNRKRFEPGKTALFKLISIVALFFTLSGLAPGVILASEVPIDSNGIYTAIADDGTKVMLYRYRPDSKASYRTNGTPILLFPGLVENMNLYISCTPPDMRSRYSKVYVPNLKDAPDWATVSTDGTKDWEPYIKTDKMRYYSLAHYLWLQGYDPWLANYRETGRRNMRTTGANDRTLNTLDTWATLDVPAAIAKVKAVTNKKMYIGGHSTGGFVSYAYLQGSYMDYGTNAGTKKSMYEAASLMNFQRHVKADAGLAVKRNQEIKGVIGFDPAGRPPLPGFLNMDISWALMGSQAFMDLDAFSESFVQIMPAGVVTTAEMVMFGPITAADSLFASIGVGQTNNLFKYLDFWYLADTDPCLRDWMGRYALSGVSLRAFGHYMDNGLNLTVREFWQNGYENKTRLSGPKPNPGKDGYYYYSENMNRMTVPLIVFSSTAGSLVTPQATKQDIISKKTPNKLDEWHVVNGTAHVDLVVGLKMPAEIFPKLGAWLNKVESEAK